ncbi:hypothetical protein EK904_009259 [Melospiza melodia maxima]|nr:hypothetical protein EK904_009259 [Melospiza melodia maxima]
MELPKLSSSDSCLRLLFEWPYVDVEICIIQFAATDSLDQDQIWISKDKKEDSPTKAVEVSDRRKSSGGRLPDTVRTRRLPHLSSVPRRIVAISKICTTLCMDLRVCVKISNSLDINNNELVSRALKELEAEVLVEGTLYRQSKFMLPVLPQGWAHSHSNRGLGKNQQGNEIFTDSALAQTSSPTEHQHPEQETHRPVTSGVLRLNVLQMKFCPGIRHLFIVAAYAGFACIRVSIKKCIEDKISMDKFSFCMKQEDE